MEKPAIWKPPRVGIIGGGQLGKMMATWAKKLGFHVTVLDPYPAAPAGQVADVQVMGGFDDAAKLRELVERCEVTTFDIETIDARTLEAVAKEGHAVRPSPTLLALIQDKFLQRKALAEIGVPVPRYQQQDAPDAQAFRAFGYPLVQKTRRGGYDGRGVVVMRGEDRFAEALEGPALLEEMVDIDKELAVLVARGINGEMRTYAVVEMVFDQEANVLDMLLAPARISNDIAEQAQQLATKAIEALDGVGIFGVEFFLAKDGKLYLNEIAPRPHNSGHFTYEACLTNQFEQHMRAVTGLPLGSTEQLRPAAMLNLLGDPEGSGVPHFEGMAEALRIDGVSVHIYGKHETRPNRKMGHVTVIDTDVMAAYEKASAVKRLLKIRAGHT